MKISVHVNVKVEGEKQREVTFRTDVEQDADTEKLFDDTFYHAQNIIREAMK